MTGNKILIVDDEPLIRETLTDFLELKGYTVLSAKNGVEGLEKMSSVKPDLVLSDVMMPDLSGYDMIKMMKINPDLATIPIIFLTARAEKDDLREGMGLGADDFIVKPFNMDDVFRSIETRLQKSANIERNLDNRVKQKTKKLVAEKEVVEEKNKNMTESMSYARFIQKSLLPSNEDIQKYFDESFLINIPKDILSGDFFWIKKIETSLYFASVDCTGHGVPGALMSVMAHIILESVASKHHGLPANHLLEKINEELIEYFSRPNERQIEDGMDMALCILDTETMNLQYSGANHAIILGRNVSENPVPFNFIKSDKDNYFELFTIKGNVRSIGEIRGNQKPFENHVVTLDKGNVIYMFSDGFKDQFGDNEKKFLFSNFRKMLLSMQGNSMETQQKLILDTFQHWRGINEQTDDILVFGAKM